MSTEATADSQPSQPVAVLSSEGLGAAGAPVVADQMLVDLLRKPFVPKEPDAEAGEKGEDVYTQLWLQNEATKVAISVAVYARLAEGVRGTTKDGKLQAFRREFTSIVSAYVVERRGKGLLVQADDVKAWLPAYKVEVLNEREIRVPDWLLLQRYDQFHIIDRRDRIPHREPRRWDWNSSPDGVYEGGE